jgi:replicative DNA helicase
MTDSSAMTVHSDIETEQALLGKLMVFPEHLSQVAPILTDSDFSRPTHGVIYRAIASLTSKDAPIDPLSVLSELRTLTPDDEEWKDTDDHNGVRYLLACVNKSDMMDDPLYHANRLKEQSALRRQGLTAYEWQERLANPRAEPGSVQAWLGEELKNLTLDSSGGFIPIGEILSEHYDLLESARDTVGLDGYSSGFSKLDNVTGGYGGAIFVVLKAKRGTGKTHHLIQPTYNCLKSGKAAVLISMDTPVWMLLNRFLAYLTGINSFRVRRPRPEDWDSLAEAFNWLNSQPLWLYKYSGVRISQVEARCNSIISAGNSIGLVALDYAELIRPDRHYTNREQELANIAIDLQNLRDKLNTTVLLLSQTNKEGSERWSEGIGNAADLLLAWDRGEASGGVGTGKLIAEKNRLGPDTIFDVAYDFATSRLRELSLDYTEPAYPPGWPWWYDPSREITDAD